MNTDNVTITNGSHAAFRWDKNGLNAYKKDDKGFSDKAFVRFSENGIYGIDEQSGFS